MQACAPELVSIVVPCFNHGRFVGEAVDSALAQDWPEVEVVVVDDGSTDAATVAACDAQGRRDRVRVLRTGNRGLAAARNHGIAASRGEFLLMLDADDVLVPTFLSRTVPKLLADAKLGIVYTDVEYFGARRGRWQTPEFDFVELLCRNLMVATSVYRRACWDAVGGYDAAMRDGFEDWEFWIAVAERGFAGVRVPEPLFRYRQHHASMLAATQQKRATIYRYIVAKHHATFAKHLADVVTRKDALFFEQLQAKYWYEARFGWVVGLYTRARRLLGLGGDRTGGQ
jgi:glycosyltransferase involved in cell wall biosynthesis